MQLRIEHRLSDDGTAIIKVAGRLILGAEGAELETLTRRLLSEGVRRFVFDFSELKHIDSTGIGRCISSLNMIMQAGGKLTIAGAEGQVRDGFRITRLDTVFRFYQDLPAAQTALG